MKEGETRKFELDKTKLNCQLIKDGINEITIGKFETVKWNIKNEKNKWRYRLVEPVHILYIDCFPGNVDFLYTAGVTEGCGIGKILMGLCLNEESMHNVEKNKDNKAVQDLERSAAINKEKELQELVKWVNFECSKLVFLIMKADPKENAFVYFNSAQEANLNQMFIETNPPGFMYPKSGTSSVSELRKKYTNESDIVDNGEKIDVFDKNWFFCLPKKSLT